MTTTLTDKFPAGSRRGPQAKKRLASAYQSLFAGHGGKEDADLVLSDLAQFTKFYGVVGDAASDAVRASHNARRGVYLRIIGFLRMSEAETIALERAVQEELLTSQNEGVFE